MNILHAIPSRGRVGRIKTLDNLGLVYPRIPLVLFVPNKESAAYVDTYAADRIVSVRNDNGARHIGAAREAIMDFAHKFGHTHVIMWDDDLRFAARRKDDATKFEELTQGTAKKMMADLHHLAREYGHFALGAREGGNQRAPGIEENTRMLRVLGYNVKAYRASGASFARSNGKEDFDVALTMLRAGYASAITNDYVSDNAGGTGAPGGCSSYTSRDGHGKAAEALAKRHPGFVRLVKKTTKVAWGGGERTDVVISWKKAAAAGKADQGVRRLL